MKIFSERKLIVFFITLFFSSTATAGTWGGVGVVNVIKMIDSYDGVAITLEGTTAPSMCGTAPNCPACSKSNIGYLYRTHPNFNYLLSLLMLSKSAKFPITVTFTQNCVKASTKAGATSEIGAIELDGFSLQ